MIFRAVFALCFFCLSIFSYEIPVDCTQIFEARKAEIEKELEIIDEQRQALEAFRASIRASYDENLAKLAKKEADINATMRQVEKKNKEIEQKIAQNQKILDELKTNSNDKLTQSYAKMKDQAAADVLAQLSRASAAEILSMLEPKKISSIMAKMDPAVASEITAMLQKGPPFIDEPKEQKIDAPAGNVLNLE
ncbi:MotE family protein [Campylobacter mucosalis]|uniref:Putative motility protein chaperone MotE n=1 Tax=Campylobacter mucosalis CCUG 21559 TaxID=1032067 RepID=A0A6G5QG47_9BACT|nr:MotE family protein [Campylobacter mucosalis]QCD44547.1 putative motility protein chaperone MotE [Campylobacter mucosalis CCUG 21559]